MIAIKEVPFNACLFEPARPLLTRLTSAVQTLYHHRISRSELLFPTFFFFADFNFFLAVNVGGRFKVE